MLLWVSDNPQNKQRLLPQTAIEHYSGEILWDFLAVETEYLYII
jgi:hypothetical protein